MILHPIACAIAFLACALSMGAGVIGSIFGALVAFVAWALTVAVMAIDFTLFGVGTILFFSFGGKYFWILINYNRLSKTTSTSRIKALMPITRSACGLVSQPWCCCSWECSSSFSRASARGRRRGSLASASTVTTRLVLMVVWAMLGTRLRRLDGGLGGTGGSDEGREWCTDIGRLSVSGRHSDVRRFEEFLWYCTSMAGYLCLPVENTYYLHITRLSV